MAGDPDHYSVILATVGLAGLERSAVQLATVLEADGAKAQASLVRQAFFRLLTELRAIAVKTAGRAEIDIKKQELQTRVRPSTGNSPGLNDFVGQSGPLPAVEGSVGINDEQELDREGFGWWELHEEGSDVHVGRTVYGLFQPGSSRPDPRQSRVHPLFEAGRGGRMVIQQPIPERRFVRDGYVAVEAKWHADVKRARQRYIETCQRAVAAAPPPAPRRKGPGPGRRRP